MSPYNLELVQAYELFLKSSAANFSAPPASYPHPTLLTDAPVCVVVSPHPDDEAISGALSWRLRHQENWRVVNIAVTLGSLLCRRSERWAEAQACCDHLGFELWSGSGQAGYGMEGVTLQDAALSTACWRYAVDALVESFHSLQPRIVICPHALDGHPVHMATHSLVQAALKKTSAGEIDVFFSEYWNTQIDPCMAVGLDALAVSRLMEALSLHTGEVARHPYHLLLPAWFSDSARRGAERVGKTGGGAFDFSFASLYGWRKWHHDHWQTKSPHVWNPTDPFRQDLIG